MGRAPSLYNHMIRLNQKVCYIACYRYSYFVSVYMCVCVDIATYSCKPRTEVNLMENKIAILSIAWAVCM